MWVAVYKTANKTKVYLQEISTGLYNQLVVNNGADWLKNHIAFQAITKKGVSAHLENLGWTCDGVDACMNTVYFKY